MADFLLALAGFDRRRGRERLGHASIFAFLLAELRLSRSAAFHRECPADLLQQFPEVIAPLRDGKPHLSASATPPLLTYAPAPLVIALVDAHPNVVPLPRVPTSRLANGGGGRVFRTAAAARR